MGKGLGINSRHFVRFGVWLSAAKYQKLRAFKKHSRRRENPFQRRWECSSYVMGFYYHRFENDGEDLVKCIIFVSATNPILLQTPAN